METSGAVGVPRSDGLRRDRLIQRMDAIPAHRLGLVIAPAGCGKTALMADWAGSSALDIAWCRVTRDDTGVGLIERIRRGWGLQTGRGGGAVGLAGARAEGQGRALLVLDDAHLITTDSARTAIESLVHLLPESTAVLVGSRQHPELDLLRSEVSLNPVILGEDDLRFRSWEVESLFRDVYGEPLLPDEAAALARHTDGWAAALHLFHLSTTGQSSTTRRRALRSLAGRNRYARGYLSRQVLKGLGPNLSEFLRRTAAFEVLTGARCDALLGRSDSQQVLLELVAQQALTTTDDDGATFRYHEVLRRHLEADLEAELGEAGLREWYARAAGLLEAEGALTEALRVRARARDWVGLRALVLRSGREIASHESSWTGLLPTAMLHDDPFIELAHAQRLLADGQLAAAALTAREALARLDDQRAEDRGRDLLAATRAWERLECPPTRRWYEQLAGALRSLRPNRGYRTAPRAQTSDDSLARPFVLLLAGNVPGSRAAARHAVSLVEEGTAGWAALGLLEGLAAMLERDPQARVVADAVGTQAELDDLGWFTRASRALLAATDEDRSRGIEDLRRVADACIRRDDQWGAAWATLLEALRDFCDEPGDASALDQAALRLEALGAAVPEAWARALAALVAARAGHPDASERARSALEQAHAVACPGAQAAAAAAGAWAQGEPARLRAALDLAQEASVSFLLRPRWRMDDAPNPPDAPPGGPPGVQLTLLGRFDVLVGQVRPALGDARPQVRQLMRVLALNAGRAMHREELAESMWPDQPSRDAIHRLQVAISQLRRVLGADDGSDAPLIQRDGECYRLCLPPGSRVDVLEFESALGRARRSRLAGDRGAEAGALQDALDCYLGDLLPEDGPADWVVERREQLRRAASLAASELAGLRAASDPRAGVEAAERAVSIDPYNDSAWRQLIALHEELGDVARAERARGSYAGVLDELGIEHGADALRPARRRS